MMDIPTFVHRSLGQWRSQRSGHNLAFQHFEEVRSTILITALEVDDPVVIDLCQQYGVLPELALSPFQMVWEGESDWDDEATVQGQCVLVPVPDPQRPGHGKLLRSVGYAETIPAAGEYYFTEEGMFVLQTSYDRAAAEERIWFATDTLRFRVSLIKTANGQGVLTASFASELRSEPS